MTDPHTRQRIRDLYAAFNRRDTSFVTDQMTPDVTWPKAFKGGFARGPAAVAAYWQEQWTEIDPNVEPLEIATLDDGRVDVEVHQVVKDLAGAVLADAVVHHIYRFRDALIAGMEIHPGQTD